MAKTPLNKVFIATSLDGFIADSKGKVDFLYTYPDPVDDDMGYSTFMESVDALLIGRKTFETVLGFGIEWPYKKPVFVWTETLKTIPTELTDRVRLVSGTAREILQAIHGMGHYELYIDGGQTIQSFLREGLIDEMTITTVPMLLGSGIRLFGELVTPVRFTCTDARKFSNGLGQYKLVRVDKS